MGGHTASVEALLAKGADRSAKDGNGKSPIDLAMENKFPMCVAKLDPAFAKEQAERLLQRFQAARKVHVLSTRFNRAPQKVIDKWFEANGVEVDESEDPTRHRYTGTA